MIVFFINGLGVSFILPIVPELFGNTSVSLFVDTDVASLRNLFYSLTFALAILGSLIGLPLWGGLSDLVGRKPVLMIGLLGHSLGYFLCAWAISHHAPGIFLLGRFIAGLFVACYVVAQAIMADISEGSDDKIRKMRWPMLASTSGFVLGPLLPMVAYMIPGFINHRVALPFYLAGCLSLINMTFIWSAFSETNLSREVVKKKISSQILEQFTFILRKKTIHRIAIIYIFYQIGYGGYIQSLPLFLKRNLEMTQQSLSLFYVSLALAMTFTSLIIQPIVMRKFDIVKNIGSLGICMGIFVCLVGLSFNATLIWILNIAMVVVSMLLGVAFLTLISNSVQENEQGKVMGGFGALSSCAWLLVALLMGWMISIGLHFMLLFSGFALIIAAIGYMGTTNQRVESRVESQTS